MSGQAGPSGGGGGGGGGLHDASGLAAGTGHAAGASGGPGPVSGSGATQGLGLRASGLGAHLHTLGQGIGYTSQGLRRKNSGEGLDVLKDFKEKIHEDENYIEFFQERIRIEEQYIAQLQKLYDRTVAKDSLQDDQSGKTQTPTARRAWAEVRDYTSREIDSRNAMAQAIRAAVVPELVKTRDEQERIRLGLKENMRAANEMYDEHARYQLPKLKKSYWSKCQLLEDHKRQEAAIAAQARLLAETSNPASPLATPAGEFPPSGMQTFSPPTSTPPLPPVSNPLLETSPHAVPSAYLGPAQAASGGPYGHSHSQSLHVMYPERADGPGRASNTGRASISGGSGAGHYPSSALSSSAALGLGAASASTSGRARSGSASGAEKKDPKEVFQDLAVQGKKGFKDFMQRLGGDRDKGKEGEKERERDGDGFVLVDPKLGALGKEEEGMGMGMGLGLQRKGTGSGGRGGKGGGETGALRGVRLKREADEADKVYRAGVFHLESLRIRRDKVFASALTNLEQFNDDLTLQLRNSLSTYVDIVHATAATNMQATEVARVIVSKVDAERDMMVFRSRLSSVQAEPTVAVPYENFYVGPCKSLIFGVSLSDYDFSRGEGGDHGRPPMILEKCIAAVDERGLNMEGLYRISGRKAAGQKMVQDIELDEEKFVFDEKDDVHAIASVLKQYLRELPEPVFNLPHAERIKYTESRGEVIGINQAESNISNNFATLRARLRRLPPIHQTTFQAIIEHLGRVQSRSASNKMDAKNIAVIFNTVIFGPDQVPLDANALSMHHGKDTVLEDLITYADLLFSSEQEASPSSSTPSRHGVKSEYGVVDGPHPGSSRTKLQIVALIPEEGTVTGHGMAEGVDRAGTAQAGRRGTGTDAELAELASVTMYTPDEELELLFDPKLIPIPLQKAVGPGYHARPLSSSDLMRSHFPLLSCLSESPPIAPSTYAALFQHLHACATTYYVVVIVDKSNDQLVASATLFVERKYIHGGGIAGHIEDVVVSNNAQGKGLGGKLVKGLKELGESVGCYKTILDCQETKVGFYEKCGFARRGVQMAFYSEANKGAPAPVPASPLITLAPSQLPVRYDSVPIPGSLSRTASALAKSPRSVSLGFAPSPQSAGSLGIPSIIDLTNSTTPSMDALENSKLGMAKRYSQQSESSTSGSGSGSTGSRVTYTVAPQLFTQVTATTASPTSTDPNVLPQVTPKASASATFASPTTATTVRSPPPLPPRILGVQQENKADQQTDEDDVLKHVPAWATPGLGASVLQPRRLSAHDKGKGKGKSESVSRSPTRKTHSRGNSREIDLKSTTSGSNSEGMSGSGLLALEEEGTERAHTPLPPGAAPAERGVEPERVGL